MASTTPSSLASMAEEATIKALQERGQVNLIVAGRSGVGKSTLINAVFQENLAETGQGRPVTMGVREITKSGMPVTIWDTRGIEMADADARIDSLIQHIRDRASELDATRHIHAAWLCIQEDGRRVEDAEIELHRKLAELVPVVVVITKARNDSGFREEVTRLLPMARNVLRVRAIGEELDDGHVIAPMGLKELVDLTVEVVPEGQRNALVAAQKASVQQKVDRANSIVSKASAAAGAAAASPIPFSDAAILVPIQIGMLARITATFGLKTSDAMLTTLVSSAAGTMAATFLGRALFTNLLKLVPGVGSVAGGAIGAATAASITAALGKLYIATLSYLFTKSEGSAPEAEQIVEEFKKRLSMKGGEQGEE